MKILSFLGLIGVLSVAGCGAAGPDEILPSSETAITDWTQPINGRLFRLEPRLVLRNSFVYSLTDFVPTSEQSFFTRSFVYEALKGQALVEIAHYPTGRPASKERAPRFSNPDKLFSHLIASETGKTGVILETKLRPEISALNVRNLDPATGQIGEPQPIMGRNDRKFPFFTPTGAPDGEELPASPLEAFQPYFTPPGSESSVFPMPTNAPFRLADDSLLVVAQSLSGLRVLKMEGPAKTIFDTLVIPAVREQGKVVRPWRYNLLLTAEGSGSSYLIVTLHRNEKAGFEAHHKKAVPFGDLDRYAVAMKLASDGSLLWVVPLPFAGSKLTHVSAVYPSSGTLYLAGTFLPAERENWYERHPFIGSITEDPTSGTPKVRLERADPKNTLFMIPHSLIPLPDNKILVTGSFDYEQVSTGSIVKPGDAFFSLFDRDFREIGFERFKADRDDDFFKLRRFGQRLYVGAQLSGPLTHDPPEAHHRMSAIFEILPQSR